MKKIAIIGGGGFCREIKCLIDDINIQQASYELVGYFDDSENIIIDNGMNYLGKIEDINNIDYDLNIVIAIADPQIKEKIVKRINNNKISHPNLIHPSVIKSNDEVILGKGNIICAGSILTCNVLIKNFVTVNLSCTIGHDTVIESYCSIMPKTAISGEVVLGQYSYIGTGATIINQITVGEKTIVGAGAVVSKNLPANCTAVGIPAKPIKFGI